jgi:hypothetical protein
MGLDIGDRHSTLFTGLSGFWQRFFRDTQDLEAFYQASEIYLGQVYLDLLSAILNIGIVDTPVFNKEYWRLFLIDETQVNFREGLSVAEDRFWYDMPGTAVTTDFLQNTIFDPDVVYERGVNFDIIENDGYVRFYADPFMGVQNTDGEWLPQPGVGWRTIQKQVGNQFTDQERFANWVDDSDVKRGDILRLLATPGPRVQAGGGGSITVGAPTIFQSAGFDSALCQEGDIIVVTGSVAPDVEFDGVFVMGRWTALNQVALDETVYMPGFSSTTPLTWVHYRSIYFSPSVVDGVVKVPFRDFEVDYFDKKNIVGAADNPYPVDVKAPAVYAVVRDVADNDVLGAAILPFPAETDFGYKHIIPGSVKVYARVLTPALHQAIEGTDYTIDYLHGRLHQLVPFDLTGIMTCDYKWRREVLYSAGGVISAKDVGRVKQLSLWVPETLVDRFTLYYNYGSLLNRFEASSEAYKAFLRGILHLYVSGPVLERIESALNLAAGYPLVKSDGEILAGYDNGEIYHATDGDVTAATNFFHTPSYAFSELDVGGQIIFPNPLHDFNKGHFRILNVIDANTVELESSYGFVDEGLVPPLMEWVLTHTYQKTVTTNLNTYKFPYHAPIRDDVMDPTQVGHLTFLAFEALSSGFTVTDYIEDPRWWHNKYIPSILWNDTLGRRYATTQLFENVIGPLDDLRIGDPGFFIGADDEGNVFTPTDGLGTNPVSLYRHCAAFILFDRYLKCHMFYIAIAPDQELSAQFMADLEELILVAKPSYTYPYVEPNSAFEELATLFDDLFMNIGFVWPDDMMLADNNLYIGDPDFPWDIGGYYRYIDYSGAIAGTAGLPVVPFQLPVQMFIPPVPGPVVLGQRLVSATIYATRASDGQPVIEGRDYALQWNVDEPDAWWVTPLTVWTVPGVDIAVALVLVEYDNVGYTPCPFGVPDTRIGFTPLAIGGTNPAYVRRGAINPNSPTYAAEWLLVHTRQVDRSLSLKIDANTGIPGGVPYTYP